MSETDRVVVDRERCVGCGECVSACPAEILSVRDGRAVEPAHCRLSCGHCAAVCREEAIRVESLDDSAFDFATFANDERWLPYGDGDTAALVRLMNSRRSCRRYTDEPIDRPLLEDLVRIGTTAPSGSNSQRWTFTVLATRADVQALGGRIARFFERLNHLAGRRWIRFVARLAGNDGLGTYYRRHYASVARALDRYRREGRDLLFHGATAAVIVGARPGASTPVEDALLATQNILLSAHTMGLGTCLIGYALEAIKRDRSITRFLGIPDAETVHAVIALGHPAVRFQRAAGRRTVVPRFAAVGRG